MIYLYIGAHMESLRWVAAVWVFFNMAVVAAIAVKNFRKNKIKQNLWRKTEEALYKEYEKERRMQTGA
jgi:hypothetical protein